MKYNIFQKFDYSVKKLFQGSDRVRARAVNLTMAIGSGSNDLGYWAGLRFQLVLYHYCFQWYVLGVSKSIKALPL